MRVAGIGLIISHLCVWTPQVPAKAPPPRLVSYGRQVAPIFALYCTGCHGPTNPSSSLQVTRFASLRAGGNLGDEIVPGHPEASILLDFLEGRRGPRQRMPQNSEPLSPIQIELIREWIKEGARNDEAEGPCFDLQIPEVQASRDGQVQIRYRVTEPALTILSVRDPGSGRELFVDEGSVKFPKEAANVAAPGEWITRTLAREEGWPSRLAFDLRIQYASAVPSGSVLIAVTGGKGQSTEILVQSLCGPL